MGCDVSLWRVNVGVLEHPVLCIAEDEDIVFYSTYFAKETDEMAKNLVQLTDTATSYSIQI
jgi:hypothetical protein